MLRARGPGGPGGGSQPANRLQGIAPDGVGRVRLSFCCSLSAITSSAWRKKASRSTCKRISLSPSTTMPPLMFLDVGTLAEAVTVTATAAPSGRSEWHDQAPRGSAADRRPAAQWARYHATHVDPGGCGAGNAQSFSEGNAFVVNGSRQNGVYYVLDTGMKTDSYRTIAACSRTRTLCRSSAFKRAISAREYANATGAVVNAVTKSGTNQFHGSVVRVPAQWSLQRAEFLCARRDSLKRNQFGATLGGPVIHDKLFFFSPTRAHACAATRN